MRRKEGRKHGVGGVGGIKREIEIQQRVGFHQRISLVSFYSMLWMFKAKPSPQVVGLARRSESCICSSV